MSYIEFSKPADHLGLVTINRPAKRNALDQAGWSDLGACLRKIAREPSIRAVILTGAGGAFCAGDDILAFAAVRDIPVQRKAYWDRIMEAYAAITDLSIPVIAAIDGPCIGGGCTLALRSDFRIGGASARFAVPPAKLGLVYPADSTALLVDAVGTVMAKWMLYSAEEIDAKKAVEIGLCLPANDGEALPAALRLAEKLASGAPISIRAAKLACNGAALGRLAEVEHTIQQLSTQADASRDYREGTAAFAAKRPARFTGE